MDDLIDAYISSPMWSERNTASMVTWSGTTVTHTDDFHANSEEQFGNAKDPSICMAPLSHIVGNTATGYFNMQERDFTSSLFVDRNMKYEALKDVYSGEGFSHQSLFHHTPDAVSMDYVTQHRASTTAATAKSALPRAVVGMSRSIERNSHELSAFSQCLENDHSIASDASIGLDNLPAFVYQGNKNCNNLFEEIPLQNRGFYLDRCHSASIPIEDQDNLHGLSSVSVGPQTNLIATALQPQMEQNGLRSPSVPVGSCMMTSNKLAGIPSAQKPSPPYEGHFADCQIKNSYGSQSQAVSANSSGCNGAVKPRVRARRGQATDPHSIAERHRREKISERLKDLQGLVPSSNKADKASVLDEIINYVKFLQHQVKVLSMSRLGATGAVVPLLTHTQTEGNLLRSSSVGQGASNDDPDNSACEQEVMKLMETDITSAMQYLQFKGLCLMPLALATELNAPQSTVQPLV